MTTPTVLLVHGAMHTPWIFGPLRAQLTARGLDSRAVQLPSSNADSAAALGLAEDAATVRAAIEAIDAPVVLAAHSYGGVPATWAAAETRIVHLVYIAAFALQPGVSMMEWMGGDFPPNWHRSPDGLAVKAGDVEQSIFSGVDPDLTAEAVKRLNWEGTGAFTQQLAAAPVRTPTTYVVATQDAALPLAVQEQWADTATHTARIRSGHSPHLSHPGQVADVIAAAAAHSTRLGT